MSYRNYPYVDIVSNTTGSIIYLNYKCYINYYLIGLNYNATVAEVKVL